MAIQKLVNKQKEWSQNSLDLVKKRYLVNADTSISDWFDAVAHRIARGYDSRDEHEKWKSLYSTLLKTRAFLPTSAALVNSLRNKGGLSGCIVLPLASSVTEVVEKRLPEILAMLLDGIGVGLDLNIIPPRLSREVSTDRSSPGPVETLISIVSAAEGLISYAGIKRSAFMAGLHLNHPDVFEFIACKSERNLKNVNISVLVDAPIREAISRNGLIPFQYIDSQSNLPCLLTLADLEKMSAQALKRALRGPDLELTPSGHVYSKAVSQEVGIVLGERVYLYARKALEITALYAHRCGDPGLLNLESINRDNPTYSVNHDILGTGPIHITTPCGEQPLLPYEVCHLGSLNLNLFVQDQARTEVGGLSLFDDRIDYALLREATYLAIRFMDDLISEGNNGLAQANSVSKQNRKIGLGIMGLADVLAQLELPYDSEEGRKLAKDLMKFIQDSAVEASENLALERGTFPNWKHSKYYQRRGTPRRNATLTTIAPTGHIATLADCSTGVEPYFLFSFQRDAAGKRIQQCSILDQKLKDMEYSLSEWIKATQEKTPQYRFDGTLRGLLDEPTSHSQVNARLTHLKKVFKTSQEISPKDHLAMVVVLQDHVDNGISKTINLANSASATDVLYVFQEALKAGLKGITVFRDGCISEQAIQSCTACEKCGEIVYLRPGDCGGVKCDEQMGGCGYEICSL